MSRPWADKYDHPVPEPFTFPETTLDRIFAGTVASHPEWVALVPRFDPLAVVPLIGLLEKYRPVLSLPAFAVSGPQVMGGYWQTPEATESTARLKDGWLFTGDLARMDADGYFFIVDRRDDMIITSGFNVYPSEIEAILKARPGVADAVVVGVPDPSRGCSIVARVVPREGESLTAAQLLEHCRERLPDYKVPRRVLIVTAIPKSPVGKPLRRELRSTAEQPEP